MEGISEVLTTSRLQLRRPRISDAEDVFAYASDIAVTRFMDWPTHIATRTTAEWLHSCPALWESGAEFTWVVASRSEGQVIGAVSLRVVDHKVDFGYVLGKQFWGNGFATEASHAVVNLATSLPGIFRIWATCDVENTASARVLEKVGLKREGVLRSWSIRPNISPVPRDALIYSLVTNNA